MAQQLRDTLGICLELWGSFVGAELSETTVSLDFVLPIQIVDYAQYREVFDSRQIGSLATELFNNIDEVDWAFCPLLCLDYCLEYSIPIRHVP